MNTFAYKGKLETILKMIFLLHNSIAKLLLLFLKKNPSR